MPASAYRATATPPPAGEQGRSWTVERVAAEHEARGLLNVLVLVARCLEPDVGPPPMGQQWERDRAQAQERLEQLYAAGLPRDFLLAPPALASEPRRAAGRDRRGTPGAPQRHL